jgi:uncharacterized protein
MDRPGHDACRIEQKSGGWRLTGSAVFMEVGDPCQLDYTIECDAGWHTRSARVRGFAGTEPVEIEIDVDGSQRWRLNGVEQMDVAGALDVDLAFTPATNKLAIRRLDLPIAGMGEVRSAWLPFPEVVLSPLDQIYRRTADDRLLYEAPTLDFQAELTINGDGIVISYAGLWIADGMA